LRGTREDRRPRFSCGRQDEGRAGIGTGQRQGHAERPRSPNGYKISGEGEGGVAGFAKGGAKVDLAEKEGGTLLSYQVGAQIGGKLAQLGQRLINGTAKKLADEFFANFAKAL
jgi:carbon monoxide dehydrogenase subunit G